MSSFFLYNNLHFALEILGALVFMMTSWLAFDAYIIRKDFLTFSRGLGFAILTIAQIVNSFDFNSEFYQYVAYILYIAGLFFVVWNLILEKPVERPSLNAILLLPPIIQYVPYFGSINSVLYFVIAFLSYLQYKKEDKKSLKPFWYAFGFFFIGSIFSIFYTDQFNFVFLGEHIFRVFGFISLSVWVWQYLHLRIREEVVLIFTSASLLMSIVVTIAFSMILISQMEDMTRSSLIINSRTVDYALDHIKEEALSKARLFADSLELRSVIVSNNFSRIEKLSSDFFNQGRLGSLAVLDSQGNVILRADNLSRKEDNLLKEDIVKKAMEGYSSVTVKQSDVEGFSIRAASPVIFKNSVVGVVVAGFPLDNPFVDGIKGITGLDMSIFEGDKMIATTISDPTGNIRQSGYMVTDQTVIDSVLGSGQSVTLRTEMFSRPFLVSYLPLFDTNDAIVGMISVAKSQSEIVDVANNINALTLFTVSIIMLILIYSIFLISQRLTD